MQGLFIFHTTFPLTSSSTFIPTRINFTQNLSLSLSLALSGSPRTPFSLCSRFVDVFSLSNTKQISLPTSGPTVLLFCFTLIPLPVCSTSLSLSLSLSLSCAYSKCVSYMFQSPNGTFPSTRLDQIKCSP